MLKRFTLILSIALFGMSLFAQPVITLPLLGDENRDYTFRTAAAGDLNLNISGSNVVWDFSNIDPDSIFPEITVQQFIPPSEAPFSNLFSDADFVLKESSDFSVDYNYLELQGDRLMVIGLYTEGDTFPAIFPEPVLLSPLPLEFGFTETETVPFVFDLLDIVDTFQLTNTYEADAWGELRLPDGITIANTIRLEAKSEIDGIVDTDEGTIRIVIDQTSYLFLSNDYGVPVATYSSQKATIFLVLGPIQVPLFEFPAQPTLEYYSVLGTNVQEFANDLEVTLFPNPTSDYINLSFGEDMVEDFVYELFDLTGKLLLVGKISGGTTFHQIETQNLNGGMYLLALTSEVNRKVLPFFVKKK